MRNLKWAIILGTGIIFIQVSCQKKQNQVPDNPAEINLNNGAQAKALPQIVGKTAWFPLDTKFSKEGDGINCTPPEQWGYIGTTAAGRSIHKTSNTTTTITCTCNTKGTCKPFSATGPWGTTRGCTGDCSNCTMTQSTSTSKIHADIVSGGFYLKNAPSRLLQNGEHIPAVFNELANLPEFQQELKKFYNQAYHGQEIQQPVYQKDGTLAAPEGYVLVGASIWGRGLLVLFPEKFVTAELGYAFKTKASCKCTVTPGICVLNDKSIFGMGSIWCDGTCNGCTLITTSGFSDYVRPYEISIFKASL